MTLLEFINTQGHRFWDEGKHFQDVKKQVTRFCEFADHSTRPIDKFKPIDIYNFIDSLTAAGLTNNTCNRYISAITKTFKEAVGMEFVSHPPLVRWKTVEKGRERFFSRAEVTLILDYLGKHRPWMKHYCIISLNTGMRLGEIIASQRDWVNKDYTELYLPFIEGGFRPKNGEARYVELNEEAGNAFKEIFENLDGNKYVHSTFRRTWNKMRDEFFRMGKIPKKEDFVFHVFRHTAATNLVNHFNINLTTVGEILGHKDAKTTEKYVHHKKERVTGIMSQLGDYNSGKLGEYHAL
jgi:integrase